MQRRVRSRLPPPPPSLQLRFSLSAREGESRSFKRLQLLCAPNRAHFPHHKLGFRRRVAQFSLRPISAVGVSRPAKMAARKTPLTVRLRAPSHAHSAAG